MSSAVGASVVGAGMFSVLLFPLVATRLAAAATSPRAPDAVPALGARPAT